MNALKDGNVASNGCQMWEQTKQNIEFVTRKQKRIRLSRAAQIDSGNVSRDAGAAQTPH
jgi:hypothetical protein